MENNDEGSPVLVKDTGTVNTVQKKREDLFWVQAAILALLLIISGITFMFSNDVKVDKVIKIVFAPFLSIVPLIFILTIVRDWIKRFNSNEYTRAEIIKYVVISVLITIVATFMMKGLSMITTSEVLVALLIAILSIISFIGGKIRNIVGMSILTGVSEGVIIFMVFFF
ncbi:MAG: hypothetical protein V1733_01120 [bacterium]